MHTTRQHESMLSTPQPLACLELFGTLLRLPVNNEIDDDFICRAWLPLCHPMSPVCLSVSHSVRPSGVAQELRKPAIFQKTVQLQDIGVGPI